METASDTHDTRGDAIPLLSLADQASDPDGFAALLGGSLRRFGFALVCDHGVPHALVERAWAATQGYFALPEADKRRDHIPGMGGARGYTPFRTEIAKGAAHVDLKEFWHIGRERSDAERFDADMPPNRWPERPAGFRETFLTLFEAFDVVGGRLLSAVARHLGLAPDWFDAATREGNSVLRLLHYPPVPADAPGTRAEAHEDIDLLTLLLGAEEAGLELLDRDGRWLPVRPPPGALVVNVGDMLQRLTNHVLPSTTHRVVNPPAERRGHSRYSMPFFLHPRPDFLIRALPQCVTPDNPEREPPIAARDYLAQRLREIGLAPN